MTLGVRWAPRRVAKRTAAITVNPWRIATGANFVYHQTRGERPRGTDVLNSYLDQVIVASVDDPVVNVALTCVQQLLARPRTVLDPVVIARTLHARRGRHVRQDRKPRGLIWCR